MAHGHKAQAARRLAYIYYTYKRARAPDGAFLMRAWCRHHARELVCALCGLSFPFFFLFLWGIIYITLSLAASPFLCALAGEDDGTCRGTEMPAIDIAAGARAGGGAGGSSTCASSRAIFRRRKIFRGAFLGSRHDKVVEYMQIIIKRCGRRGANCVFYNAVLGI